MPRLVASSSCVHAKVSGVFLVCACQGLLDCAGKSRQEREIERETDSLPPSPSSCAATLRHSDAVLHHKRAGQAVPEHCSDTATVAHPIP